MEAFSLGGGRHDALRLGDQRVGQSASRSRLQRRQSGSTAGPSGRPVARRPPTARPGARRASARRTRRWSRLRPTRPWASRSAPRHSGGMPSGNSTPPRESRPRRRRRHARRRRWLGRAGGRRSAIDDATEVGDRAPLAGRGEHYAPRQPGRRRRPNPAGGRPSRRPTQPRQPRSPTRARRSRTSSPTPQQEPDRVLVGSARAAEQQLAAGGHDGLDQRRRRAARAGWPARLTATQPRATASAEGRPAGSAPVPTPGVSRATVTEARWPTGSTIDRQGSSMPSIGTSAGGRLVRRSSRVNAQAIGSGESFVDLDERQPPASATDHTRCTASPPGTRIRVSKTGAPSSRRWRTAASVGRAVPAVVGGDVPVERRRAVPRHDRAPGRDVGRRAPPARWSAARPVDPADHGCDPRAGTDLPTTRPPVQWAPWTPRC